MLRTETQTGADLGVPLRIGEAAPDFTARSTRGLVTLSDYRGRWLAMFSHPGDFTPVCTSEFVSIARARQQFEELGCDLLALSIDSLFSHLAWIKAIKDHFDVVVEFPIIEDPTLEIAKAYGMVGSEAVDASAVRTTYFLDPDGIVRAMTSYPSSVGRSVDEMIRLVRALQRVQDGSVLTPEGWQPGGDVLAAPSYDIADVVSAGRDIEWFYRPLRDQA